MDGTRNFLDKDINRPDVEAALGALAAIKGGWDRVVAHFAEPRIRQWATNQYGPVKAANWWGWLLHKPIKDWGSSAMPGDDHVEYREREGRRVRISQPYQLNWDELRDLVRHCEANGLKAQIHGMSWWFPASTIAVVVEEDARKEALG